MCKVEDIQGLELLNKHFFRGHYFPEVKKIIFLAEKCVSLNLF